MSAKAQIDQLMGQTRHFSAERQRLLRSKEDLVVQRAELRRALSLKCWMCSIGSKSGKCKGRHLQDFINEDQLLIDEDHRLNDWVQDVEAQLDDIQADMLELGHVYRWRLLLT